MIDMVFSYIHSNKYCWGDSCTLIANNGAGIICCEFVKGQDYAFVSGLSVVPSQRKNGIGTALLKECERVAGYNKRFEVRLEIEADDTYAEKFYSERGYSVLDEFETEYGKYKLMGKEIDPQGDYL